MTEPHKGLRMVEVFFEDLAQVVLQGSKGLKDPVAQVLSQFFKKPLYRVEFRTSGGQPCKGNAPILANAWLMSPGDLLPENRAVEE